MMTQEKQISPSSLAFKMQIAHFIEGKLPRQQKRKEYTCNHNIKMPEV